MIIAGLLAGGIGSRVGYSIPKQFLEIGGISILKRKAHQFIGLVDKIIVACPKDYIDKAKEELKDYEVIIIEGGKERFNSLLNIVNTAYKLDKDSIVIMHDIVRPFTSKRIILNHLKYINNYDAVTTCIQATETLGTVKDKLVSGKYEKESIWVDQGPQTFRAKQFLDILDDGYYTEISKLYFNKGLKVGVVEGDVYNFKITTKIDLILAEALVKK